MPVVQIDELEVHFPFDPYDVQKQLMTRVVECCRTRQNGLLESPTDTGKTLSLLCATLAWQKKQKTFLHSISNNAEIPSSRNNFVGSGPEFGNGNVKPVFNAPKIIYSSRTHSQLSQAIQKLKRSHYKNVKSVVLGSRDLMCIHEEVSRLESSSAKIMACHLKVNAHTCSYYNNINATKEEFKIRTQPVVDIEDLVVKGKTQRFCPFFMSRKLVQDAEIVFMPYNYLLDPKLRSSHGIELKNCVIILDEGHNIAKICEEAVSFEIKSSTIAHCVQELTKAMNEYSETTQQIGNNALTKDLSLRNIIKLKQSFLELEEELDKIQTTPEGKLEDGEKLLKILFTHGFPPSSLNQIISDLDAVSSFLTGSHSEATGCDKFSSILRVVASQSMFKNPALFGKSYKVFVQFEESKRAKDSSRLVDVKKSIAAAKIFNFWCFNPAVGLETMMGYGPRCVLLASGTLSPMTFLAKELHVPFAVQHSNPHIISDNQLFASIVTCGPNNVRLSSRYETREDERYLKSLGELIRSVCAIVPKGVLVFFPSYYVMEICKRKWVTFGIWAKIQQHKKLLFEPRGKDAFKQVMEEYYAGVKIGHGACLMAVCRGKVSEGLDFTDDNGRAVIITGIPYSPAKDPHVVAKQQYLNNKQSSGESDCISGSTWYQLEATRALNQAIGSIIRHVNDYGAILICDERCASTNFRSQLSGWVEQRLKISSNFDETEKELAQFFGSSVQKQRAEHAKAFSMRLKQLTSQTRTRPLPRIDDDLNNQAAVDTEMTTEELLEMYGGGDDDCVVVEYSNGRKPAPSQASSSSSTVKKMSSSSKFKKASSSSGSLFGDLATTSVKSSVANFNAPVPVYPKPFAAFSKSPMSISYERVRDPQKKKLKLATRNCSFGGEVNESSSMSTTSTATQNTANSSNGEKPSDFSEFWNWVKEILGHDNQPKFVKAVKSYKTSKDVRSLAQSICSLFPQQHRQRCFSGLSRLISPADAKILKDILS